MLAKIARKIFKLDHTWVFFYKVPAYIRAIVQAGIIDKQYLKSIFYQHLSFYLKKDLMDFTTCTNSLSFKCGYMGKERISFDARSVIGKSPFLYPKNL